MNIMSKTTLYTIILLIGMLSNIILKRTTSNSLTDKGHIDSKQCFLVLRRLEFLMEKNRFADNYKS